ncbi:MAG TPA: DUF2071 domain-containing protein [Gemmatimonadaceae bacterium]|nr:DUF2071 domain-containing protein [Gemmatimonadaceae bacterium]
MARRFLTADWRYLAMLHYEVEPAVLASLVPKGTELDDRDGHHYIGLVGFLFLDTRIFGLPALFHQNFEEVNLRFYVRRDVGGERRAGVTFIREMVPLTFVSEAARLTYNEPYRTVPMQHALAETNGRLHSVEYLFGGQRDQCRFALHADGPAREIQPGSQEEFFSERGWGYTVQRDGGTIEYRVKHERWRVWPNARWELVGELASFYDPPFADIISGEPSSAFIADGSSVSVYLPQRIA